MPSMLYKLIIPVILLFSSIFCWTLGTYGASSAIPPGAQTYIGEVSIALPWVNTTGDVYGTARSFGMAILKGIKVVVSGFALIYIILIGVNMIIFSHNEERIKTQRMQFLYTTIGFLFLNVPGIVYYIIFWPSYSGPNEYQSIGWDTSFILWNSDTFSWANGFVAQAISFFEVFAFAAAIFTLTWAFWQLMTAGGDEEKAKRERRKIIFSVIALMVLSFAKVWGEVITSWDWAGSAASLMDSLLALVLYFAAPTVVFFLILGAFYMITSAWDEERAKKAKNIILYTFIGSLILLWSYSFMQDIASLTL